MRENIIVKRLLELSPAKLVEYFGTSSVLQVLKHHEASYIEAKIFDSIHNEIDVNSIVMLEENGVRARALVTYISEKECYLMLQDGSFKIISYSEIKSCDVTGDMFNIKEAFKLLRDREYDA